MLENVPCPKCKEWIPFDRFQAHVDAHKISYHYSAKKIKLNKKVSHEIIAGEQTILSDFSSFSQQKITMP